MLERFKVPETDAVRVREENLRETVTQVLKKMGVPDRDSEQAADVLLSADLRGVDTHGVSNVLRSYVQGYNDGVINPRPNWKIVRETPSTASIDSDAGLGIIVAPRAMDIAIEKAKKVGIGMVTMSNGRHLGMAAYHAMMALEHDMIGMCMTSTPPLMTPTYGAEQLLGTNPLAVAAPADQELPFVFDAATTVVSGNKIRLATRMEHKLAAGWIAKEDGTPIMEEVDPIVPSGGQPITLALLPVGSTREMGSHKGYGFACIVDILGGIITGGGYGVKPGLPNFGHSVTAYSIEAFMVVAEFKRTMAEWCRMLANSKPAAGQDRVYYAGLPEAEEQEERKANGIPLHEEVIGWFKDICAELDIPFILPGG